MDTVSLKHLWESETRDNKEAGGQRFREKMHAAMQAGDFSYEDISVKELYEAVGRTAFPTNVTSLILKPAIIAAYNQTPTVGMRLVTKVKSNKTSENIVGFTQIPMPEKVLEGDDFPRQGIVEKYVTVANHKYGEIVEVTQEAIQFDQTGQLLLRMRKIGEMGAWHREKVIMYTIQDQTGYSAYYPANTQTTLYARSGAYYSLYASNALADWSDVENARAYLSKHLDDNSNPIILTARTLLVPEALSMKARYIANNTRDTRATYNADNPELGITEVISSPFLDAVSQTAWYYGDFKTEFIYTEVVPLEVKEQGTESDAAFERDVFARVRVKTYFGVGALDYRYVVKSTA